MLSERIGRIAPSATLAMTAKAAELRANGIDVINLSVGEPDFDTPSHIVEAGQKALADGFTHYGPPVGLPELREAIAEEISSLLNDILDD